MMPEVDLELQLKARTFKVIQCVLTLIFCAAVFLREGGGRGINYNVTAYGGMIPVVSDHFCIRVRKKLALLINLVN